MGAITPIRIRLNDSFYEEGMTVFLAYESNDTLFLEDVLIWKGNEIWSRETFQHRWGLFQQFLKEWMPDTGLQSKTISIASYTSLQELNVPPAGMIVELIPNQARQKRLIVLLQEEAPLTKGVWIATREIARGPDVYSVTKKGSTESEGIACVQSLAVSRALRLVKEESFPVQCEWHERFKKWEIVSLS
jgi:hypothetical protein